MTTVDRKELLCKMEVIAFAHFTYTRTVQTHTHQLDHSQALTRYIIISSTMRVASRSLPASRTHTHTSLNAVVELKQQALIPFWLLVTIESYKFFLYWIHCSLSACAVCALAEQSCDAIAHCIDLHTNDKLLIHDSDTKLDNMRGSMRCQKTKDRNEKKKRKKNSKCELLDCVGVVCSVLT